MAHPGVITAETTGFPLSRPIQFGSRVGSFLPVQATFSSAATDTNVAVSLGRTPSGFLTFFTPSGGGLITAGANNGSDWTTTQLTLQATVAGTYGILVF
jgi:hypothetical protein